MRKLMIIVFCFISIILTVDVVKAAGNCEIKAVKQMAKILYHEVGGDYTSPASENFFGRLATASVILNHTATSNTSGSLYDKMLNFSNKEYDGYSTYKNKSFDEVVRSDKRGEMLYVSALVLSGKFSFPKEIIYQCSKSILDGDGAHEFTHSANVYFGYSKYATLSNTDVFGNTVSTNAQTLRSLAKSFEQNSYDSYNSDNVCNLVSNINGNSSTGGTPTPSIPDPTTPTTPTTPTNPTTPQQPGSSGTPVPPSAPAPAPNLNYSSLCANEGIKNAAEIVGYVVLLIKWLVPIILIVFGMIDFGKAVISSDEKALSKATSSLIKRIIAGVVVFFVPTLVMAIVNFIGFTKGIEDSSDFATCTKCVMDVLNNCN